MGRLMWVEAVARREVARILEGAFHGPLVLGYVECLMVRLHPSLRLALLLLVGLP